MAAHGSGHDADGARTRDEHILAHEIEGKRGVNGVAQGIENGADLIVDFGGKMNGVKGGKLQIFRKGAGNVHSHALGVGIEMEMTGPRHAAFHSGEMALARDPVSHLDSADVRADGFDDAAELVTHDHRHGNGFASPFVPVPNVDIGAADTGLHHLDQHVIGAHHRNRLVAHLQTRRRFGLHQCTHRQTP